MILQNFIEEKVFGGKTMLEEAEDLITKKIIAYDIVKTYCAGHQYSNPSWGKKLWFQPYRQIIEYLAARAV